MARPTLLSRRTKLRGSTPPPAPVSSNVSDEFIVWANDIAHPVTGSPGAPQLMDADDLAYWKAEGVDGFVMLSRYPTIIGGNQTYTGDQANTLTGAQWDHNRALRNVIMPRFIAAGLKGILLIGTKNYIPPNSQVLFTGQTAAHGSAANWTNVTIPAVVGMVKMCRAEGLVGLMFDNENYPANDGSVGITFGGNHTNPDWETRSYELGVAITTAWPDVVIFSYYNHISGSYEEFIQTPSDYPRGYQIHQGAHLWWKGLSRGMAAGAPLGGWNLVFQEAIYYKGLCVPGARQMDHNGFQAVCARDWPHWRDIHDRLGVEAFMWMDRGVPGGSAFEDPYDPSVFSAQHLNYRDWGMVLRGTNARIWQDFTYTPQDDLHLRRFNVAPHTWDSDYQPELVNASTAAVISNSAPSLTITTPTDGSSTASASISVTGSASDDFGVSAVTWRNAAQPSTHVLTVGGSPSGGSFQLAVMVNGVFAGDTAALAYNANAAAFDTALEAVVGAGVTVTGSGPFTIVFPASMGDVAIGPTGFALTGGTNPNIQIVESVVRRGHLTMDWVRDSGSVGAGWVHHHNLSTAGQGGPIPLIVGSNVITFTARDTKGATTTVTRTVTRT